MAAKSSTPLLLHAVGDIGFGGALRALDGPGGAVDPFAGVRGALEGAAVLFGNLETPLVEEGCKAASAETPPGFGGAPAGASFLAKAGFSVVSVANNHIMDYGENGLRSTLRALDGAGVQCVGSGASLPEARRPVILDAGGWKVGLLAYASPGRHTATAGRAGAAPLDEAIILEDLRALRGRADVLVVSLHFGLIYSDYPRVEDQRLARLLCGAGASLVLGHHPHVLQGIERYGESLIAYSLGEILFDPASGYVVNRSASEVRRESMVLRVEMSPPEVQGYQVRPCRRKGDSLLPEASEGEEARSILARVDALSLPLSGEGLRSMDGAAEAQRRSVSHQWDVLRHHLRRGNLRLLLGWLARARPRHLKMALQALWMRRPHG